MKELEQFFESLKPIQQFFITLGAWAMANCSITGFTTILGIVILLLQIPAVYYSIKLKKIQYDKECKGIEK